MACSNTARWKWPARCSNAYCKLFAVLLVQLAESQGTGDQECHDGSLLGRWSKDQNFLNVLAQDFQNAKPFPNVVIPDFFSEVSRCEIYALCLPKFAITIEGIPVAHYFRKSPRKLIHRSLRLADPTPTNGSKKVGMFMITQ
jgi:hypothetical protein